MINDAAMLQPQHAAGNLLVRDGLINGGIHRLQLLRTEGGYGVCKKGNGCARAQPKAEAERGTGRMSRRPTRVLHISEPIKRWPNNGNNWNFRSEAAELVKLKFRRKPRSTGPLTK